jgi:hypothetical protein
MNYRIPLSDSQVIAALLEKAVDNLEDCQCTTQDDESTRPVAATAITTTELLSTKTYSTLFHEDITTLVRSDNTSSSSSNSRVACVMCRRKHRLDSMFACAVRSLLAATYNEIGEKFIPLNILLLFV